MVVIDVALGNLDFPDNLSVQLLLYAGNCRRCSKRSLQCRRGIQLTDNRLRNILLEVNLSHRAVLTTIANGCRKPPGSCEYPRRVPRSHFARSYHLFWNTVALECLDHLLGRLRRFHIYQSSDTVDCTEPFPNQSEPAAM